MGVNFYFHQNVVLKQNYHDEVRHKPSLNCIIRIEAAKKVRVSRPPALNSTPMMISLTVLIGAIQNQPLVADDDCK